MERCRKSERLGEEVGLGAKRSAWVLVLNVRPPSHSPAASCCTSLRTLTAANLTGPAPVLMDLPGARVVRLPLIVTPTAAGQAGEEREQEAVQGFAAHTTGQLWLCSSHISSAAAAAAAAAAA